MRFRRTTNLQEAFLIYNDGTYLGSFAGWRDGENKSTVVIPDTVTEIGPYAFNKIGCLHIQKIIIPESVHSIDVCAFSGCRNLVEFEFSREPVSIASNIFSGCTSLAYITLPDIISWDSLIRLMESLENNCPNLKYIIYRGNDAGIAETLFHTFDEHGVEILKD